MLTIPVPHMRPPAMQTGLDPNRLTRKLESGPQAKAMVPVTDPMIDTWEKGALKYCKRYRIFLSVPSNVFCSEILAESSACRVWTYLCQWLDKNTKGVSNSIPNEIPHEACQANDPPPSSVRGTRNLIQLHQDLCVVFGNGIWKVESANAGFSLNSHRPNVGLQWGVRDVGRSHRSETIVIKIWFNSWWFQNWRCKDFVYTDSYNLFVETFNGWASFLIFLFLRKLSAFVYE